MGKSSVVSKYPGVDEKHNYSRAWRLKSTACINGHDYADGKWTRDTRGFRVCLICRNKQNGESAKRKEAKLKAEAGENLEVFLQMKRFRDSKYKNRQRMTPEKFEAWLKTAEEKLGIAKEKKNKLDYLKLTPIQSEASDKLNYALDDSGKRTACRIDPAPYMDYDERTPPSAVEAAKLCAGCDVIEQCLAFAKVLKPKTGVWGGTVFIDGKPQN